MKDDDIKRKLLLEEIELLEKSFKSLKLSVEKCKNIIPKEEYTFEEMESFDSLSSKFGRTSDIYTQKVLRTIWELLHEPYVPFIDFLNKSEKLNLIKSADKLIEIRDLRNQIRHEYIPEAVYDLVPVVIDLHNVLEENIRKTKQFLKSRNWI